MPAREESEYTMYQLFRIKIEQQVLERVKPPLVFIFWIMAPCCSVAYFHKIMLRINVHRRVKL